MRQHPKWTDARYWQEIALRLETLRQAERMAAERERARKRREASE